MSGGTVVHVGFPVKVPGSRKPHTFFSVNRKGMLWWFDATDLRKHRTCEGITLYQSTEIGLCPCRSVNVGEFRKVWLNGRTL